MICKIIGRVDDYVVCKDGTRVTRIDFIESGKHIKACQWVQEEQGKVTACIVPDDDFTEEDRLFVKEETLKRVGMGNMEVEAKAVSMEELIYTHRGKFKLIVNRLK